VNRLIESGVRRVVIAQIDPNPLVSGKGVECLRSAGIQVDVGLMQEQAGRIIEAFACRITTGLPLVAAKVGMSLDGKIGTAGKSDRWISSLEGREFGQQLRLGADALLVGVGTVISDDPELTYRGKAPKARPMLRVILDSELRMPSTARLLQSSSQAPVVIFCRRGAAKERRRDLEKQGAEVLSILHSDDGLNLQAVLQELAKRDVLGLLVEGGSQVHWSFLARRLVDKFYFLIAPLILGGSDAVPSVGGEGYKLIADSPRFRICRSFYAGPDIVLETYPSYSRSIISPWLFAENAPSRGRGLLHPSRQK
jgi:diaminohydroxyphosphoribosylaminopyrimidine deaminase/5-amino-6-(5-phosphoribosylamino)uracil reductase